MQRRSRTRTLEQGQRSDPRIQPATHEDLYVYAQQEAAEHSAQSACEAMRLRAWDEEMISLAKQKKQ